jgi:Zn-dependent metalloprotease
MKDFKHTSADQGGIHINSGIPNRAFYEVAIAIGGNAWEKPGKIWYESLLRLNSRSTFQDCAQMTFDVAGEFHGKGSREQEAVKKGWKIVGIEIKERAAEKKGDASECH